LRNDLISCPFANKYYFAIEAVGGFINGRLVKNNNNQKLTKKLSGLVGYDLTKNKSKYLSWLNVRSLIQLESKRVFETWAPVVDFYLLFENKIDSIIVYNNETFDVIGGDFIAKNLGYHVLNFDNTVFNEIEEYKELSTFIVSKSQTIDDTTKNQLSVLS
jgi:fructose-1,6-bisphosphatase/inositol monophosphatase family enzyme